MSPGVQITGIRERQRDRRRRIGHRTHRCRRQTAKVNRVQVLTTRHRSSPRRHRCSGLATYHWGLARKAGHRAQRGDDTRHHVASYAHPSVEEVDVVRAVIHRTRAGERRPDIRCHRRQHFRHIQVEAVEVIRLRFRAVSHRAEQRSSRGLCSPGHWQPPAVRQHDAAYGPRGKLPSLAGMAWEGGIFIDVPVEVGITQVVDVERLIVGRVRLL